jgi:hypothetical protein
MANTEHHLPSQPGKICRDCRSDQLDNGPKSQSSLETKIFENEIIKEMKNLQSHLGTLVLSILLLFCLFLMAENSFAADQLPDGPSDGKIEIEYPADRLVPYRERRSTWGFNFGLQVDQMLPDQYRSPIDDESYTNLFGSSTLNLTQGQLGVKYNFSLGSLGANLVLAAGEIQDSRIGNDVHIDTDADLQLTKMGLSFSYVMDNLFPEPYVAPYIEGQMFKMDWLEKTKQGVSKSGVTGISTALTIGVLIQLNWIDSDGAFLAQESSGLQNTYLDLFVSQYNSSGDASDPNFQTDYNYGGGLRFEF